MGRQAIYWDSDVFLALLKQDKSAKEIQGCEDVWANADKGHLMIVTSTLTTAEVIHKKGTPKLDPEHRPSVSNFFRQPFITQRPLTREIAELARDVVWDHPIKPKDAVHVATAAYFTVPVLHTFDGGLLSANGIVVNGHTMRIEAPHSQSQAEIFIEHKK